MAKTSVNFLLDRTGSMEDYKAETIGGFNAYLEELRRGPEADSIEFTLVTFDSISMDKICVRVPVKDAPLLTDKNFIPRSYTNLLECCTKMILAVDESLVKNPADKVIVCFQTDGKNNVNPHGEDGKLLYTVANLRSMVKERQAKGWQFNYLGAGIDAYDDAEAFGISRGYTMSYNTKNMGQTQSGYRSMGRNTRLFAHGQSVSMDFSDDEKLAAGDVYAQASLSEEPIEPNKFSLDK
jgi:hypothetical protein